MGSGFLLGGGEQGRLLVGFVVQLVRLFLIGGGQELCL